MDKRSAKELIQTILWKEYCEEIDARIESTIRQLKSCNPDQLVRYQSRITFLEEAKNIPQDVIDRES